jgi:hypothetical protein
LKNIHKIFCEDIGYQGAMETLRKEIHKLGFRWRKFKNNRKILMEKHDIRHAILMLLGLLCLQCTSVAWQIFDKSVP